MAMGLTGCAGRGAARAGVGMRPPLRLTPVRVSHDRIIRATVGLRPEEQREREGLDITEHGERAYNL